jgi:SMI1 / KNR4 family (SUKH-1)
VGYSIEVQSEALIELREAFKWYELQKAGLGYELLTIVEGCYQKLSENPQHYSMATIERNTAPTREEIETFLKQVDFSLPNGFIDFFKDTNGADISSDEKYILLWALTDMVQLNKEYNVEEYAPEFFIFGSDGGDTAFAIEKSTGDIYEMPFIGMSKEEAVFKNKTFPKFIESI